MAPAPAAAASLRRHWQCGGIPVLATHWQLAAANGSCPDFYILDSIMFQFQALVKAPVRPDEAGCHASVTQLWAHSEPHHGWPECHSLGYLRLVTMSRQVTVPVLPPFRSPAVTVKILAGSNSDHDVGRRRSFRVEFRFLVELRVRRPGIRRVIIRGFRQKNLNPTP